jgi:tRNA pseudouridine55 synthase
MAARELSGVLIFDKPRGRTSHDVVARVRRVLRQRAVGHVGTLDPMATGVLVVVLGEATKLSPWLAAQDKAYEATVAFGTETDTLDAEGRDVRSAIVSAACRDALSRSGPFAPDPLLDAALGQERERVLQVPPAYSAIHADGERAYAKARRGSPPTLSARPVRVQRLELLASSGDPPECSLSLEVSKGYYVRALARDLAISLGTVGHLTRLRRVRSGAFGIDEALEPDAGPDQMESRVQPLASAAARALPVGRLTPAGAEAARHGRRVEPEGLAAAARGPCAWLDAQGALVAVGEVEVDGSGRVLRGFSATS